MTRRSRTGRLRGARPLCAAAALVLSVAAVGGCAASAPSRAGVDTVERALARDRAEADRLYAAGVEAAQRGELEEARTLFEQAVALYPLHGRATNDLGVIHYRQGRLYDAAVAFDDASRRLLDRPEPFYNLGLVLEDAGRYTEAAEAYRSALMRDADDPRIMQNLARLYLRQGIEPERTADLLERALLHEQRPEWRHWMQLELAHLRDKAAADRPPPARGGDPPSQP